MSMIMVTAQRTQYQVGFCAERAVSFLNLAPMMTPGGPKCPGAELLMGGGGRVIVQETAEHIAETYPDRFILLRETTTKQPMALNPFILNFCDPVQSPLLENAGTNLTLQNGQTYMVDNSTEEIVELANKAEQLRRFPGPEMETPQEEPPIDG